MTNVARPPISLAGDNKRFSPRLRKYVLPLELC